MMKKKMLKRLFALAFGVAFVMPSVMAVGTTTANAAGKNYVIRDYSRYASSANFMVGGYFVYESFVLGVGAAAVASVPFNLVQGAVGIVVSVTAAVVLEHSGILKRLK